jgi:predicted  nucleic acid-binding Zn-ribbon protein
MPTGCSALNGDLGVSAGGRCHTPHAGRPIFQPIRSLTMSKRDAYIEKMKAELDAMNARMDALEVKAKDAKDDARDKYREEMKNLRHQSDLAVAKLDELKVAGEDSWERVVTEMEKIRDAFTHSFHYFKSQL